MNYKRILHTLGIVLCFEGALMIAPLICAVIYKEPEVLDFFECILICLGFGGLLLLLKTRNKNLYSKDGFVIVALSWIVMSVFGSLPFVFSGSIPNFIDAFFETASGFTTTGASIISNIEILPKSILFWRSFTHWIGGMGVLVFLVALLPLSGGSNLYLMKAESTGPSVSKLVPKVKSSAKILYGIYIGLSVILLILLLAGGMNFFDAITHTFGTAGTGGFGVKNSSVAGYSSYHQIVITVFMVLFGIDFSVYYLMLLGKFKLMLQSDEVKAYIGIILISTIIICINCVNMFENVWVSLRHSAFQVSSIMTTTGFSTDNFDKWPELSKGILVLLMFIGACAGSTGGGIKVSRILIYLKSIGKEIAIAAHPKLTKKIKMSGRTIEHETVRNVNVFMAAYLVVFVVSVLFISLDNLDFTTNFTAVAATLNNIGPGLAKVGPTENFSVYSNFSTLVLTFDMLIGRLEVFPMLVLFSPYTWKK
ncbi:MAG: TrkH family potassium uptake protein [Ruminococcaceae bacterium]|nr:TrkH family potassium uptake protein [Oscillospiraceae bacterium]